MPCFNDLRDKALSSLAEGIQQNMEVALPMGWAKSMGGEAVAATVQSMMSDKTTKDVALNAARSHWTYLSQ